MVADLSRGAGVTREVALPESADVGSGLFLSMRVPATDRIKAAERMAV